MKGRFKDPMHGKNERSLPVNNRWPGRVVGWVSCAIGLFFVGAAHPADQDLFRITVVDEQTRRGVPLVELRTVNNISLWTDSNGITDSNRSGGHPLRRTRRTLSVRNRPAGPSRRSARTSGGRTNQG